MEPDTTREERKGRVTFLSFWSRYFVGMIASVRVCLAMAGLMLLATGLTVSGQYQTVTVQLNPNEILQTIDGFGVAQVRYGPWHPWDNGPSDPAQNVYSHPNRSNLMDLTFSALHGIGATILRVKITSALIPELQDSHNWNDVAQAWIMREALARGPVKILATAWSPPPWMKTNNSTLLGRCSNDLRYTCPLGDGDCGCDSDADCTAGNRCLVGALDRSHYPDFAEYLLRFVRDYAADHRVSIYAVSMANEPDTRIEWDGAAWDGQSIATFLDAYLRPTFSLHGITTKVVAPEAAVWNVVPMLMEPTTNNSRALRRVDIIAGHQYHGELKDRLPEALLGKRVWMTEYSHADTWSIDGAIAQAKRIHTTLTGNARASAWLWFIYFGGRPAPNEPGGLVRTDGTSVVPTKAFWALGHYSKFVRPDFVRVEAKVTSNHPQVLASAYKDPVTGQLVIVVINEDTVTRFVRFSGVPWSAVATPYVTSGEETINLEPLPDVRIGAVAAAVPAQSIVTYVTAPPRLTSDILWRKTDGNTMVWLGSIAATASYPGIVGNDWQIQGIGDFDGNGRGDILWRSINGDNVIWTDAKAPGAWIAPVDNGWRVAGIGDFDSDGRSDILWRSLNGDNAIWPGGNAPGFWVAPVDNGWRVAGIGDFNGDDKSDILWRSVNGDNVVWPGGKAPGFWLGPLDGHWQIQGVEDFDGNRASDILWRCLPQAPATACGDATAGSVAIWHFSNGNYGWTIWPGVLDNSWQIQSVGRFDR
jgi:glucuronoarabinoxylan endo-1,4-beta-xylanase